MRFKVARYIINFLKVLTCSLQPEKLALLPEKNDCLGEIVMVTRGKRLFTDHHFDISRSRTKPAHFSMDDYMPYFYIRRNQ